MSLPSKLVCHFFYRATPNATTIGNMIRMTFQREISSVESKRHYFKLWKRILLEVRIEAPLFRVACQSSYWLLVSRLKGLFPRLSRTLRLLFMMSFLTLCVLSQLNLHLECTCSLLVLGYMETLRQGAPVAQAEPQDSARRTLLLHLPTITFCQIARVSDVWMQCIDY